MQLIVNKTKSFVSGPNFLTVNPGPGVQQVPDWVQETNTFKLAQQDGSIQEVGLKTAEVIRTVYVPTKEEVLAAGYTPEAADSIIAEQEELRDVLAGKRPAMPLQPATREASRTSADETEFNGIGLGRSEERRVGKECRSRWS